MRIELFYMRRRTGTCMESKPKAYHCTNRGSLGTGALYLNQTKPNEYQVQNGSLRVLSSLTVAVGI